ncbi:carbohydrate ABC transporter permease [Prauserella rugosa]|uniref:Multiple sugar transport system permease protein n=1 Tax=Prauserella rugosa TaxID=43354 RepID=A0A660CIZ8_9PSEU|nr:sugar ABC transporter permease [Prauserella rugosa]KID31698.1 permease component of ABC-type sugar transporter [Prauserella sp. Am3]KMS86633.1 ABC transporter permease [Streptomyces regensis]TWH21071.1 multiple sugar transport system permease protein [Prauserella rugosa]
MRSVLRSPWLLLTPSIVLLLVLFGWPLVDGVLEAFTDEHGFTLAHWQRLFDDPYFLDALRNTLLLIVIVVPVQLVLAVAMSLLVQARPRFVSGHFYLWCIPLAISELAAGLVWLSIFDNRGYLNSLLVSLGLSEHGVQWLSYDNTATMLLTVVLAEIWRATSLVFVIVVAGVQMVPREYDEAAQVFGASFWQRLRHVTLPMLKPSLQVALILRTILALQAFAVAQALTGRDFPLLVGETYEWYVGLQNPAVASAVALVVLAISVGTAVLYLRTVRSPSEAES